MLFSDADKRKQIFRSSFADVWGLLMCLGETVTNVLQAGDRRPLAGLSEQRAAAASASANGLIITADSTFDDYGEASVLKCRKFKRM